MQIKYRVDLSFWFDVGAFKYKLEDLGIMKAWPKTEVSNDAFMSVDELVRFHRVEPNTTGKGHRSAKRGGKKQLAVFVPLTAQLGQRAKWKRVGRPEPEQMWGLENCSDMANR